MRLSVGALKQSARSVSHLGSLAVVLAIWTVVGAGWSTSVARADSLGPIPADAVIQSRCAPMSLGPHVVHVGREIFGSAGPKHDACGPGGLAGISWVWGGGIDLVPIRPCAATAASCAYRAIGPTGTPGHRIMSGCLDGNPASGAWISCDFYAVIGK